MGMFDWVNVEEVELPDGVDNTLPYQTKAFHCGLGSITINKDGRLIVPDCFNNDKLRDANFHGRFNFYTTDKNNEWVEFEATFTEGTLTEIESVERHW
jgi:hypothetical protein